MGVIDAVWMYILRRCPRWGGNLRAAAWSRGDNGLVQHVLVTCSGCEVITAGTARASYNELPLSLWMRRYSIYSLRSASFNLSLPPAALAPVTTVVLPIVGVFVMLPTLRATVEAFACADVILAWGGTAPRPC